METKCEPNVLENTLLPQILELLNTACEASIELLQQIERGDYPRALTLIEDLRAVVQSVRTARDPLKERLEHAYTLEMLDNVEDTLDDIRRSLRAGDRERAAMKTEYQLYPFLRQLMEAFYFWGCVYPDKGRMERYYREEFAPHYANPYISESESPRYQLSIVVPAYNHLEVTKQCIEQLLKETDLEALNAELILIDHGSTDGTLEYFESLGIGKVIHFKKNARMYMFTTLAQICHGKYFSYVSNDVLVTRNWANILMQCLDSDPKMIAAVPATPNISNLQMLHVPSNDPAEFIAWANKQNHSDPFRWNDRARLMPPLGMYRSSAVSKIGFADPYFYSMEFWDDDFSLRARRAGYRQVVCDDVACYHFGSVTGKEAQKKEGTLSYGRELFRAKHGVDPWGHGFCYDLQAVRLILQSLPDKQEINLLGIDCGMGDTTLQIRNELRHRHKACRITNLTCQPAYVPDLEPQSDAFFFAEDLVQALSHEAEPKETYDCIVLSRPLSEYAEPLALLQSIHARLSVGGFVVITCPNPYFALTLHGLLQFSFPGEDGRLCLFDFEKISGQVSKLYSSVQALAIKAQIGGLEEFVQLHYGNRSDLPQIAQRLSTEKYYYLCKK